ncbi:ell-associated factor Eaf [Scaptodrosophila lebanonensis]|uniref:Ell-associated factor Eaf n=1 Tax=Drosophila lebanonensis TaxID=7225 RepID=A0A6J2TBQ9_DROLE|nr:ell-associated factor Eaf [Scaptodrosophila lebanonensis]
MQPTRRMISSQQSQNNRSRRLRLVLCLLLLPYIEVHAQYSRQWQSQAYGYNLPQYQQQQQQQLQPQATYRNTPTPLTYNAGQAFASPLPITSSTANSAPRSIWSGAPIVVDDSLYGEDSSNNNNYDLETDQHSTHGYLPTSTVHYRSTTTTPTRAANHNYNNVAGYQYFTQQQQQQLQQLEKQYQLALQQQKQQQESELLAAAEARRNDNPVIQIGNRRPLPHVGGNNYYEPPLALQQQRSFAAKYASHYANYLRKYPQRLRALYNTGAEYIDK